MKASGAIVACLLVVMCLLGDSRTVHAQVTTAEIAKRVIPAVVLIKTTGPAGDYSGSGFIVDPSGVVVTNVHVIEGGTAVSVQLANGDIYDNIRVTAFDERKDIAVLQLPGFSLPTVALGDSD